MVSIPGLGGKVIGGLVLGGVDVASLSADGGGVGEVGFLGALFPSGVAGSVFMGFTVNSAHTASIFRSLACCCAFNSLCPCINASVESCWLFACLYVAIPTNAIVKRPASTKPASYNRRSLRLSADGG